MILSWRHNFLFVKSRKTGGSSIETFLARFALPDGIVSKCPADESDIRKAHGAPCSLNSGKSIWQIKPSDLRRAAARREWPQRFLEHDGSKFLAGEIGQAQWDGLLKVAVVRNPFERVVSDFFWRTRRIEMGSWSESRMARAFGHWANVNGDRINCNWRDFYQIDGHLCLDMYLRYEFLADDLGLFLAKAGIDAGEITRLSGIRLKSGFRSKRPSWRRLYELQPQVGALVSQLCRYEISEFGYKEIEESVLR